MSSSRGSTRVRTDHAEMLDGSNIEQDDFRLHSLPASASSRQSSKHGKTSKITPEELSSLSEKANFGGALRSRLYSKSFHNNDSDQQQIFKSKSNQKFVTYPKKPAEPSASIAPAQKRKRPNEVDIAFVARMSQDDDMGSPSNIDFRNGQNNPFAKSIRSSHGFAAGEASISGEYVPHSQNGTQDKEFIIDVTSFSDPFSFIESVKSVKHQRNLEFVYLVRANRGDKAPYNPYDLEIVSYSRINPDDYYTMSSSGVTHFIGGEAEFSPLEQWIREYHIFQKVLSIPFFKKFRMWKAFAFNRRRIVQNKVDNANKSLSKNLFSIQQGTMQEQLREIRTKCLEMEQLIMFHDNEGKKLTIDGFSKMQEMHSADTSTKINKLIDEITELASVACQKYFNVQQLGNSFNHNATDAFSASADGFTTDTPSVTTDMDDSFFDRTLMNQISNDPYQMSYTEMSRRKNACLRIIHFLRMVDFMIIDSLMMLNHKSVNRILHKVTQLASRMHENDDDEDDDDDDDDDGDDGDIDSEERKGGDGVQRRDVVMGLMSLAEIEERNEKTPLFRTELILQNDNLSIIPQESKFVASIDQVINGFFSVITVGRIMWHKQFEEYLEPILSDKSSDVKIGNGPNIREWISGNEEYRHMIDDIHEIVHENFNNVKEYITEFKPVKDIYLQNQLMDIKAIERDDPPLDFFRQAIAKYKSQNKLMYSARSSKNKGFFFVDSSKIKRQFLPSPSNCLRAIHVLLPVLGRRKNDKLFATVKGAILKLQSSPSSVEEFADYLNFIDEISETMESIENDFRILTDMYRLMEDEEIVTPSEDKDMFNNQTAVRFQALRATLEMVEGSKEDKIAFFSADLQRKFKDLRNTVEKVQEDASHEMISDMNRVATREDAMQVVHFITDLREKLANVKRKSMQYAQFQEMFKVLPEHVEVLPDATRDVEMKLKLWSSITEWDSHTTEWKELPFTELSPESVSSGIDKYSALSMQVQKGLPENAVVSCLISKLDEWKIFLPIVNDFKNPNMQQRHIVQLEEVIQYAISTETDYNLNTLLDLGIVQKRQLIEEISQQASNEAALEEMLRSIRDNWSRTNFEFAIHKEFFIIGSVDDISALLEDDIIKVGTILASSYVKPIQSQVQEWDRDLRLTQDTLNLWVKCQQKWIYLESVLSSPDIANSSELHEDAKHFTVVDRFFKSTMKKANETKNVKIACTATGLNQRFKDHNETLERIEKSLERYLETKRNQMPRLYFLSNDDLLDILSQSKNPHAVQRHLEKIFDNIKSIEISPEGNYILSMTSKEGENVKFVSKTKKAMGQIEEWLHFVENNMFDSLREYTKQAVRDYSTMTREQWIMSHECQIVLTVSQIFWARDIEACLSSENPRKALEQFLETSKVHLSKLAQMTRGNLKSLERKVVCTLIIIDVHARDVLTSMIEEDVNSTTDFGWMKQLRYYWDMEKNDCIVRQSNSSFQYGYEYQGAQSRLVITPLTDRVYMTLTGALHLNLGGAPAGPAGTGKTETVKDLAKAMAVMCVVYNCSDGVTSEMMYKFFSGIVQTGAWACFDEFNRINIEVLSVIASQLQTIQDALRAGLTRFHLEYDKEIMLKPSYGVFITMNPGYAGRTELPDNLKALFRPVAVMIPDYGLISEVILFSEGYEEAKSLSRKMVQLYKLSSEQLSAQHHYDFGMRAMKSVLVMAGELKRARPDVKEEITLMRAMRDSNIPKFVKEDVSLFEGIVSDLFPGVERSEQDFGEIQDALMQRIHEKGLQPVPHFVKKVIQLFDTCVVRHGVMLVGPTGGGKSEARNMLADTLTYLRTVKKSTNPIFQAVRQYVLNPKSISYGELYGTFNPISYEWHDGLIPHFARKCVNDTSNDDKWIVFDGPVDTLWIESMNSVLDDSKLLCLDNTERIQLNDKIHFIFEVQDLAVASPATVSRCGMVYVDPEDLGYDPFVKTWLDTKLPKSFTSEHQEYIYELISRFVPLGLDFVRTKCREGVESVDLSLVSSLCDLFVALINAEGVRIEDEETDDQAKRLIDHLFVFSFIWSIGGNIVNDSRDMFDKFVRDELRKLYQIPTFGSVFDYFMDFETNAMVPWDSVVPKYVFNPETPYFDIIVPTVDTVTYSYFLNVLTKAEKPVLLVGSTGVGKTSIIANAFDLSPEQAEAVQRKNKGELIPELVTIQFSAQTSSERTQETIESKLAHRKNVYQAPQGKRVILFIDDLNMPALEEFGAQPPIELLRQLLGEGGFYDVKDHIDFPWKKVEQVTLVAACGPPGGGRNPTTPRISRMFHKLNVPDLSDDSMYRIFNSILSGFLEPFVADIRNLADKLVRASVNLYNQVCTAFRPTPACAHYTFNLRDLSKVFQGMLQVNHEVIRNAQSMCKLWLHESQRCFYDRLTNEADRNGFEEISLELMKRHFKGQVWEREQLFGDNSMLFGNFMEQQEGNCFYEQIAGMNKLPQALDDYLMQYNLKSTNKMDLVFFTDAAKHAARIVRVLRQDRGNCLLVGVGGSGKQSLTRLAASIAGYELFEIKIRRGYNLDSFREDLQTVYSIAGGVDSKSIVFMLSDTQIVHESFLEDIANILNSGEVPNLFPSEEREIINELRPIAQEHKVPETRDAIFNFFINRVRNNLHVVLCMSPVGDAFRNRCRMMPSLVNCCTIDWFDEWPKDALHAVAERKFMKINIGTEKVKDSLVDMCVDIHIHAVEMADRYYDEMRRRIYITPARYLEFIGFYEEMLEQKRIELNQERANLNTGLSILKKTNEDVERMQKELKEMQPILVQKTKETEDIIKEVRSGTAEADNKRAVIAEEEKVVNEETQKAEHIEREAKSKLDKALPALEEATKAVQSINSSDISEIKMYQQPPEAVKLTLAAVCVMFKEKTDWDSAKKLMSQSGFTQSCITYDKDNIPSTIINKLNRQYINDPMFNPDIVGKSSTAAKSLCLWVRAMVLYSEVVKQVEPLKAELAEAQTSLKAMTLALKIKQDELAEVQKTLDELNVKYEQKSRESNDLNRRTELSQKRLAIAEKLTTSLDSEYNRWTDSIGSIDRQLSFLAGNIFLSSACVVYYGPFESTYRMELVNQWIKNLEENKIPLSERNIEKVLATPVQLREWGIAGLPADRHSIQNAVLAHCTRQWPLMIDPQGQANAFTRKMEMKNQLRIIRPSNPANVMRTLDQAIRIGVPVLLEDLNEVIDPSLDPLLQKHIYKKQGRTMIMLQNEVDYNMNFKFVLTTKLANPHYLPEVCNKVNLVNFTVTSSGLSDQLLGDTVRILENALEEERDRLIVSVSEDKKMLTQLEEQILASLSSVEGNILDREDIIKQLDESKRFSTLIEERVKKAEETEREINEKRERYRSVSTRGSILFFIMADLANIDPMYQYSLDYFKQLFNMCLEKDVPLEDLISRITSVVYNNVCRGLFEKDKLIFSFLICCQILRNRGDITDAEWNFFTRGSLVDKEKMPRKPFDWLSIKTWEQLYGLEKTIPAFAGLCNDISVNGKDWKRFCTSLNPHVEPPPNGFDHKISAFQHILLIKCVREEKVLYASRNFVQTQMGDEFIESPQLDLERAIADANNSTPIIFILSQGADPTDLLKRFAESKNLGQRLHITSLGQGQEDAAKRAIEMGKKNGDWVLLQNCHLFVSFLPQLEVIISSFAGDSSIHKDFRLWLTSMPSVDFPIPILQNGLKLTNEAPKGIRSNMLRTYRNTTEEYFDSFHPGEKFPNMSKGFAFKKLLFGLSMFHAIVQERKKFGPLGWTTVYEFNDSDLSVAKLWLQMFLQEQDSIPWDSLKYVIGEIVYGGRVTDPWDRRCILNILEHYFSEKILAEGFQFSDDEQYRIPDDGNLASFVNTVEKLPHTDEPELFSMHENANIVFQMQETNHMLKTIVSIQPRTSGSSSSGGGGSSNGGDDSGGEPSKDTNEEEIMRNLAQKILNELPDNLDKEEAGPKTFVRMENGVMHSLSTVLSHEMLRFNVLLDVIRASMKELLKALNGQVVMSAEIERAMFSLLSNRVPDMWSNVAYPSLNPLGAWIVDLHKRIAFMRNWLRNGPPNCFWISGFFFPQGLMTGVLQTYSRKHQVAIDALDFNFRVLDVYDPEDIVKSPDYGVYIYGLYIDGAKWDDERKLLDQADSGKMQYRLPVVHFLPEMNYKMDPQRYAAPLYKTSERRGTLSSLGQSTNFIVAVHLPCTRDPSFFVLQGSALLCELV